MYLDLYLSMHLFSCLLSVVDELVFVLIDAFVLLPVQVLSYFLVKALVCVLVEQHFQPVKPP